MLPAMSIEIRDRRRQFTNADYEPLDLHYTEQTVQVHIMAQYAQTGLESAADALALALDYFTMPREQFTTRWMVGRSQDLRRRTTPESYQRIVTSLNNRAQQEIVTQERRRPQHAAAGRTGLRQDQGAGAPHRLPGEGQA